MIPEPAITCSKLTISTRTSCEICSKLTIKTRERGDFELVNGDWDG